MLIAALKNGGEGRWLMKSTANRSKKAAAGGSVAGELSSSCARVCMSCSVRVLEVTGGGGSSAEADHGQE